MFSAYHSVPSGYDDDDDDNNNNNGVKRNA